MKTAVVFSSLLLFVALAINPNLCQHHLFTDLNNRKHMRDENRAVINTSVTIQQHRWFEEPMGYGELLNLGQKSNLI